VTLFPPTTIVFRALSLIAALSFLPASHADLPDIIDKVRPSIVGVGTTYPARQPIGGARPNQLLGTGFAVGDGSIIATNFHVLPELLDIANNQTLAVFVGRGPESRMRAAELIAEDRENDLALLRILGDPLPALPLGNADSVREGEMMVFTGFPIGAVLGLYAVTHRGIVSSITPIAHQADNAADLSPAQLRRMRNPQDVFQLDAIAYPGNSGSPVYRESNGEVIGVLNSVFVKESRESVLERPSGISFAIPVSRLKTLLESVSDRVN
jgi:serine protease Do